MRAYETSIIIDASPEVVWEVLAAVADWPRWLPTVKSVDALDGERVGIGRRFELRQPKLRPATWIVSAIEPGHRFEWQCQSPGLRMVADHRVEGLAFATTSVLLRFEFRGALGYVLGPLFGSTARRYVEQEARALKAEVERRSTTTPFFVE